MRHLVLLAVIAAAALTGGCLSVVRFCKCRTTHTEYRTEWSEEDCSNVVVEVHHTGGEDPFAPSTTAASASASSRRRSARRRARSATERSTAAAQPVSKIISEVAQGMGHV